MPDIFTQIFFSAFAFFAASAFAVLLCVVLWEVADLTILKIIRGLKWKTERWKAPVESAGDVPVIVLRDSEFGCDWIAVRKQVGDPEATLVIQKMDGRGVVEVSAEDTQRLVKFLTEDSPTNNYSSTATPGVVMRRYTPEGEPR